MSSKVAESLSSGSRGVFDRAVARHFLERSEELAVGGPGVPGVELPMTTANIEVGIKPSFPRCSSPLPPGGRVGRKRLPQTPCIKCPTPFPPPKHRQNKREGTKATMTLSKLLQPAQKKSHDTAHMSDCQQTNYNRSLDVVMVRCLGASWHPLKS